MTPQEQAFAMIEEFYQLLTWSDEREKDAGAAAIIAVNTILKIFTKKYDEDYYLDVRDVLEYWIEVKLHIENANKDYE